MKMNIIDLMVCVLYKFHRKKNEHSIAGILSKNIFAIVLFALFVAICKATTGKLPWSNLKIGNTFFDRQFAGFLMWLPFFILTLLITSKSKIYEEYELSDHEYMKGWTMLCVIAALLILLFLYIVAS